MIRPFVLPRAHEPAWVRLLFFALVLCWSSSAGAQGTPPANPYQVRLQAAQAQLKQQPRSPAAIGPVLELVGLIDRLPDDMVVPLLAPVAKAAAGGGAYDPLVGAWAALHLARLHDDRGEGQMAAQLRQGMGLIENFWVLGPFEAQGRSSLSAPLPPEASPLAPQAGDTFEGKFQTVAWRRFDFAARSGMLLLDAALAPQEEAAALLLVYVRSPKTQTAALRLGSAGPVRAWLNGKAVLSHEVERPARLDQDAAVLRLEKGENVLVIKSVNLQGAWRLVARLTDPDGRALPGVETSLEGSRKVTLEPDPVAPASARRLALKPPAVRQLGADLEARWQRALNAGRVPQAQSLGLALARLWASASPFDQQEKPAERVLKQTLALGDELDLWRLMGEVAAEDNDRRRAFEMALRQQPGVAERCLLLSALGDFAQLAHRPVHALELRQRAAELDKEGAGVCWPAHVAIAEEARVAGMTAEALQRLQSMPVEVQQLPPVRKRFIRVLQSLGRVAEARAQAEALAQTRTNDPDVVETLLQQARHKGDVPTLLRLYQGLATHRPDLPFWVQDWARVLEGAGQTQKAAAVLQAALVRLPGSAELHESLGRLWARAHELPQAVAALDKALSLRPQNPGLRRYKEALARIGNADSEDAAADLVRRYASDVTTIVKQALAKPTSKDAEDASRVLLERRVVRVHENGLSEVLEQRLVHVLTEPGARQNANFYIRYTPGSQEVEVRQARVYRRNEAGDIAISAATGRDDRDLSEPWYALYYDNRAEVVTFEGLRPGDVMEIQYTVADVASRNELAGYFGDFQFVAETTPIDLWQYVLVAPSRKPFYFHTPQLAGFTHNKVERGGDVEHHFEARGLSKLIPEPSMPGWAEVAPYLHVSTYENWEQVGRWYWSLVAEQLAPDAEVRRVATEAVKGAVSLEEKVRAVHKRVIQGTRYVGLEFGIHGYKPYCVSQVLARRFGDCKDKASLLVAMLKLAGVEAEMVLLRTRRGGDVQTAPASLAVFDHAIAYVPALDLYLDGTAEFSGAHELPYQDQGVLALRVGPKGSMLVHTPVLPSSSNQAIRRWDVAIDASGDALVNEQVSLQGQAAPEWRQHYQSAGERLDKYGKVWNARFPGSVVTALDVTGVDDPNLPVKVAATIEVPNLATAQGARLVLPVSSRVPEYLRSYARLSTRRHDLMLAYPWQHHETLVYRLPAGWRVARAPASAAQDTSFGSFRFDVEASPDTLTITTHLDMREHRFSPRDYPAFRKFLSALEASLRERVELEKREAP